MKRLLIFLLLASAVSAQRSYRTNAPTTENPIAQSSNWTNGLTTGLDWGNVQTSAGTPGVIFGTSTTTSCPGGTGCNDSTAILSATYGNDQYACATIYLDTSLSRNANFYELELRLRTNISGHSITGYEFNIAMGNDGGTHQYTQIVRWNGALDNFTILKGVTPVAVQNGDRFCASAIGNVLTSYLNGVQLTTFNDSTYPSGHPGVGMFNQGGTTGDNAHYGFSRFNAYDSVQLAASCNTTDVQTAVTAAAVNGTVMIPAGSCTWGAGGISVAKSINVTSMGNSGRIVAVDNNTENLTVGTGSKSIVIGTYSPGFGNGMWLPGSTFRVSHNNDRGTWMQGTVTSFNAGTSTLVLNVTSSAGSGTFHQWLLSTIPNSVITNNTTGNMWTVTEPTTGGGVLFSDFKIVKGTSAATTFSVGASVGGQPTLFHDMWMEQPAADAIDTTTNKGVIWAITVDGSTADHNQLATTAILRIKGGTNTWTTASTWGAADTTGTNAIYFEYSDLHALQAYTDNDDNGKMVMRYDLVDSATFSTHGADTSNVGQRYFEFYNNRGVYKGYGDSTSLNLPNGWIGLMRGGSFVMHDNNLDVIGGGSDYATRSDVVMTVMNLGRNAGPDPCWGLNTTGGVQYHAPRQAGMGRVTGTGVDGLGRTNDSITYVGDVEPIYMWNNARLATISLSDYSSLATNYCGPTPDTVANYIQSGRDFFNTTSTAKPSYTAYTSPHPLENSFGAVAAPSINISPSSIPFGPQAVGTTSAGMTVTITNAGNADDVLGTPFFTISGTNSGDIARSGGTCTNGLTVAQGGGNCTIILTFTPAAQGARNAQLNIAGTATQIASILGGGYITIATPTFTPVAGTYATTQNVTISTTTGGAIICYTNDGSTPTANGAGTCTHGTTYSGPVVVSTSQTLKAMGTESGFFFDSSVATAAYVITPNTKFVTILGGLTINGGVTLGPP